VSDVVHLSDETEVMAKNQRRICVMYLNTTSGFEVVQGVLDTLMTKIGAVFGRDYRLEESKEAMFFPKRGANILLKGKAIGSIGVLHPEVLSEFHIKYPVTCFEIYLDEMFEHFKSSI
jgi:phenylalanyl-tRNA synthetase beta chain